MLLTFPFNSPSIKIVLDKNELSGSIPTEVGLLTELTSLVLCKQLFSVLLVCFET